jgi:hypothetical protein
MTRYNDTLTIWAYHKGLMCSIDSNDVINKEKNASSSSL